MIFLLKRGGIERKTKGGRRKKICVVISSFPSLIYLNSKVTNLSLSIKLIYLVC
jgi:hypothetical protein